MSRRDPRLDLAPLEAYLPHHQWWPNAPTAAPRLAELAGVTIRSAARWRRAGTIPLWAADRAAVALGLHPALLWPEAWRDTDDDLAVA